MKKLLLVGAVVLLVLGAGAAAAWFFLLRDEAPGKASLANLPEPTTAAGAGASSAARANPDGTWAVQQGPDVFAGYRVEEQFAADTFKRTAAGRSPAVTGSMTVSNGKVTAARFDVDMTKLKSGSDRRDGRMRSAGLQTDTFPTASFALAEPIVLPAPQAGVPIKVEAKGDLSLHGVTRRITLQLEARWDGDSIAVSGGTLLPMSEFGIAPPSVGGFVTVDSGGVLELQLVLTPTG